VFGVTERRACRVIGQHRSTQRRRLQPRSDEKRLTADIVRLASIYGRYGYRRITALLRQEGWTVNAKRVERIWRREGLKVPHKQPKRGRLWLNDGSCIRLRPTHRGHVWSYDFVADRTHDGKAFRMLTVIDEYSRECLAIEVGSRLRGEHVAAVLNRLVYLRGVPRAVFCDNGAEFTGQIVDLWAYTHKVRLDFSRPGTPTDNAHIESFNGSLRDEFLNLNWFSSVAEARRLAEIWRRDFNDSRPHMAHNGKTPTEFAEISGLCHGGQVKIAAGF